FGGLAAAADITRASYLFFLKPVIAAVLAIFILEQEPTLLQALAILLVTGSVFVEMFWPRIAGRAKA
ncbi:MAG: EamA family transporter, partial [Pseudomonadota bacterium]